MSIIIGGSGSSGTTLLRSLLNRQKEVYSGPEMNLLNKPMLFDNWNRNKALIAALHPRRLETGGWFPYPGTRVFDEDIGWASSEILDLIEKSSSVTEFANTLLSRPTQEKGAQIWIEKTPSNAYCFSRFLNASAEHKCILMCRNPFDTVASLVNRGLSEYFATGLWLYNTASAMQSIGSSRVMLTFYEHLIDDPEAELSRIFEFLSLDPSKIIVEADKDSQPKESGSRAEAGFSQWQNDPRGEVRKPQNSTFDRLTDVKQQKIVSALNRVEVSLEGETRLVSARDIAGKLGFDWREEEVSHRTSLRIQRLEDLARRSAFRYSTGLFNYPGRVR